MKNNNNNNNKKQFENEDHNQVYKKKVIRWNLAGNMQYLLRNPIFVSAVKGGGLTATPRVELKSKFKSMHPLSQAEECSLLQLNKALCIKMINGYPDSLITLRQLTDKTRQELGMSGRCWKHKIKNKWYNCASAVSFSVGIDAPKSDICSFCSFGRMSQPITESTTP